MLAIHQENNQKCILTIQPSSIQRQSNHISNHQTIHPPLHPSTIQPASNPSRLCGNKASADFATSSEATELRLPGEIATALEVDNVIII